MVTTEYYVSAPAKLTFAFVSDLHGYPDAPVLDEIEEYAPDAVLVGGDYIHDDDNYKMGIGFLQNSAKRRPTFVSLGNHERRFTGDIVGMTRETGAVLLDNEMKRFCGVVIGGFSSGFGQEQGELASTPTPDLAFLRRFAAADGFKILLCHHPEYFDKYIRGLPVDLTLSGHAHGGQWRFFGRGVFAPGQGLFPKYTSGIHEGRFIIGRGIGNPVKIPRISNPPELVIVHLAP